MEQTSIFQKVKSSIDIACEKKNHLLLNLESLGFFKQDLNEGKFTARLFHDLYTLQINKEVIIEVEYKCYDQSKPFQILPDMNKIEAKYLVNGVVVDEYYCSYED